MDNSMNETEREIYYGKSMLQWLTPTRKFLKWSALVLLALLVIVPVVGFVAIQYWAHSHFKSLVEDDIHYADIKKTHEPSP